MSEAAFQSKWPLVKLVDCARIVSGATPNTSDPRYWDGGIKWATPKDISDLNGYPYLDSTPRTLTAEGLASCSAEMLPPRSVLLSSRAPIGLVAINRMPVATNQGFKSFVPDTVRLDAGFLYHWLRANRSFLENLGTGATFKEISKAVMTRVKIPLPPLDEQKRIATVLDKADALRRQRQESLQLADKLLQSVFVDMFGDPEAMPQPKLEELLKRPLRNGLSPASGGVHLDTVFTLSAITRGHFNSQARKDAMFASSPRPAARVNATDFLICRGNGNLHLCGRGQFPTKDAIGVVFPDTIIAASIDVTRVSKAYFETLWNQPFVRRQIESAARTANGIHKVNQTALEQIKIPLPDYDAQVAFGRVSESVASGVGDLDASAEHMENLFLGLRQRALRGELDLSRLVFADTVENARATDTVSAVVIKGRYKRPGSLIAPSEIETQMIVLENRLDTGPGDSIAWDENYFKYRTLSQVLQPPFSFAEIWEAVEYDIEEPSYEIVKDKVFEYVAAGILEQKFDETRKEIVFYPRR